MIDRYEDINYKYMLIDLVEKYHSLVIINIIIPKFLQ